MKTKIGISPSNTLEIAHSLNIVLADEHILYIKTRRAHWNVEGPDFLTIHRFFEEQYKQLEGMIDDIAERIRTIGHYAQATLRGFLNETHLSEETREKNDSAAFIRALLQDHETIILHIRENIERYNNEWKDAGTSDFITAFLETHEKNGLDAKGTFEMKEIYKSEGADSEFINHYEYIFESLLFMQIEFLGEKLITIKENETILQASLNGGIPHFHACGGMQNADEEMLSLNLINVGMKASNSRILAKYILSKYKSIRIDDEQYTSEGSGDQPLFDNDVNRDSVQQALKIRQPLKTDSSNQPDKTIPKSSKPKAVMPKQNN